MCQLSKNKIPYKRTSSSGPLAVSHSEDEKMGFFASVWSVITSSAKIFALFFLITNVLNLLPDSITFTNFNITDPRPMTGKLAANTLLNKAERLFENEIKGPEGLAVLNGKLYTSLYGGYVVQVSNKIMPLVKFGQPCEHIWEEDKCGRPLGLATTPDGHLVVADAYYGIWKINIKTKVAVNIVKRNIKVAGKPVKIFNDVTVAKDGTIYWSHSSTHFDLYQGIFTLLVDPSGRLIKYDPVTKQNRVLIEKLYFANGIALSEDEEFILVSETGRARVTRYYLKGPKATEWDVFADGLPGLPDGLRPNGRGGYYVSLNVARDEVHPIATDIIALMPYLRRTLARFLAFFCWSLRQMDFIFPNDLTHRLHYMIAHFEMLTPFHPNRTTFIELSGNGEINDSFHGFDGSIRGISDVIPHKGYLYFGSPYNNYLGRIKLSRFGNRVVESAEGLK